ncbi:hypothetical protein [Piscinibacter koreensis]|uniref:Uncharacterized protein n=1 Tax=Piscinibacter koreensis TaxID=2742824 RepID=A0A7Y6NTI1_9BURK|nr:hypothetical protein [Schlegelella koreensis]NUZ09054.1 hypothetical protein [Schlegelella koreensis]
MHADDTPVEVAGGGEGKTRSAKLRDGRPAASAPIAIRVGDVYVQGAHLGCASTKVGKQHEMPYRHNLDEYLHAYIDGAKLAGADNGFPVPPRPWDGLERSHSCR